MTNIDRATRKVTLSVKAREVEEEKKAMKDYGSAESGASLGEILGAALRSKEEEERKRQKQAQIAAYIA